MFDTLGFLWLHRDSPPHLLYLLEKLVDGLSDDRMRPRSNYYYSIRVVICINQTFIMEPAITTDVCDEIFKSNNITVHLLLSRKGQNWCIV